jgi:hypothetical protein
MRLVLTVLLFVAASHGLSRFHADPDKGFKTKCNVCQKIIVPALDKAIFASTPEESTKQVVEDAMHVLPKKFRYDPEKHEVESAADADEECEVVKEEVHMLMWDPHTVATLSSLVHLFHHNAATKHHLRRLISHYLCPCGDDKPVRKEDAQYHEMLMAVEVQRRQEADKHDLHHNWVKHPRQEHKKKAFDPQMQPKELTPQQLEELKMKGAEISESRDPQSGSRSFSQGQGPRGESRSMPEPEL